MKLYKINNRVWKFVDNEIGEFSPSKFTINELNNSITIVYFNNLKSKTVNVACCEIYDVNSNIPFTTTNGIVFMAKLEELNCPCFQRDETINNFFNQPELTRLISVGSIVVNGTNIEVGIVEGLINGVNYQTTTTTIIPITLASLGFSRKDILVLTTNNIVISVSGQETDTGVTVAPTTPENTLFITQFDVNDTSIATPIDPIIGTEFKKKSESAAFVDGSLSGAKAVIQLRPQGNSFYAITGAGLVSIDGFGLDLITGNPSAEPPYSGKDLIIQNLTAQPFDLVHDGDGMATAKFSFLNGQNLTVPPQGVVWVKYFTPYCEVVMKSWSDAPQSDDTFSLFFAGNNLNFSTLDTWYCQTRPFGISTAQSCGTGVTPNSSLNTSSAHPIPQGFKIDKILFGIFSKGSNTVTSDLEVYVQVGENAYESTSNNLSSYQVIAQETISTGTTTSTPKFQKELTIADYNVNTLDVQWFQFAYRERANTNTLSISFLVTFKKA